MMLRNRRTMLGAMAAVVGMTVPIFMVSASSVQAAVSACAALASTTPGSLCVESSTNGSTTVPYVTTIHQGDQITDFKWLVNEDKSTGDPALTAANVADCLPATAAVSHATALANPALAIYETAGTGSLANCQWPSVHASAGHSTVIASGNQGETNSLNNLPDGKYLISVTAENYKIDGVHFAVANHVITSVNEELGKPFIVRMNPLPKKTATVRIHVYNDNASTNGQWDGQTETLVTCADATPVQVAANCGGSTDPNLVGDPSTDMSGFSVAITDVLGAIVTTDVYGGPLCTQYETDAAGNVLLNDDGTPNPVVFGDIHVPTGTDISNAIPQPGGATGSTLEGTQSTCLSDHYGDIVIPNMGPNRYAATIIPPDPRTHNGDKWVQTTTLEGGHDWDTWNIEGGSGYDTELIVGGERVTPVAHGFVKLTLPDQAWNDAEHDGRNSAAEKIYYNAAKGFTSGSGNGELTGTLAIGRAYIGSGGASPLAGTNLANAKEDGVIKDGLVSISCLATCNAPTDTTIWTGRARTDGTFDVTGLETGDYSVAFWDETQNYIMAIMQYHVTSSTTPTVTVSTATVVGGVPTVTFSANPNLAVGATIFFTSTDPTWSGNFQVLSVSPDGLTVTLHSVNGSNPTAGVSGAALPTVNVTDVGHILLPGWFTDLQGSVFNDLNGDGIREANEPGIPDFVLTERTRGNSLQDQGAAVATTNDEGTFDLSQGYPLGQFLIVEAYNPRYKNTGFTYTTDNDPTPHTVNSAQVDINFLPVIGLSAKLDWGVQAYGTGTDYWSGDATKAAPKDENGGIVGTVTYDVTRNEFDPAFSVQEDYQPGVSGISMQLWKTNKTDGVHPDVYPGTGAVQQWGITAGGATCMRPDTSRGTNAVTDAGQGCKPYDYYVTESWQRPVGCQALDVNGNPLTGEMALPPAPPAADIDYSHNPDNLTAASTPAQAADCIEAPMSGFQIGGNGTVDGNYALTSLIHPATLAAGGAGGPALEHAYANAQNNPAASDALTSGDYLVEAVNPVDTVNAKASTDPTSGGYLPPGGTTPKRLYRFTDETAINVMAGDTYVPQDGFTTSGDAGGGGYSMKAGSPKVRKDVNSLGAGTVAKCAGGLQTLPDNAPASPGAPSLHDVNPAFADAGGSPYGGLMVPVCDAKLVTIAGGRSMNPGFSIYTDVPTPSKFYGLVNDDLNVNVDRRSIMLGEVAPASNVPVGIYDENGNWKMTAHSDVNGFYEAIVPSMDTYNCPLPAGPCPNMYRLVGNDPGTLAHKNLDYNPQFRTIATEFQAWTGVVHPVDQAPTHNGITIEGPAAQFGALSLCALDTTNPVLFAIDQPYFDPVNASKVFTVKGSGFGATAGTLKLGGTSVPTGSWTDTQLTFSLPANWPPGPYQLSITNTSSHLSTVNGLTFHVLAPTTGTTSTAYIHKSDVYEVTPLTDPLNPASPPLLTDTGQFFTPVNDAWDSITNTPVGFFGTDVNGATVGNAANTGATSPNGRAIQRAIQAAYNNSHNGNDPKLIVIYPNTADNYAPHNPNAAYFENVVLHGKVKLQGVGPGGATSTTDIVHGTNIDASQFWSATQVVPPGGNQDTADGSYSDDWRTFADALARAGSTAGTELPEGAGVTAIAESQTQYGGNNKPNASVLFRSGVDGVLLTGGDQQGNPGNINTIPGAIGDTVPGPTAPGPAQGGAITTDQYVRDFNITNDQIQSNGGTYGTIRIGTPDLPGDENATSNHNDRLNVANNRIVANGGTNLAGALGIFAGASSYKVTGNDFCGNFSAEYGGAISHYGASPGGTISKNRIYYNQGYDEGGGIMIAGALPANNSTLSPGAGGLVGNNNTRTGVTIDSNTLISNQSNDDGGGLRFLMAGDFPFLVENNIIANNLSTHEGGGVALDDAPNVSIVNNTIVKNITTATAATNAALGTGPTAVKLANPAGLSTAGNSMLLQADLVGRYGSNIPNWSKPKLLNNIFADNRAGWAILPTTLNFNQSAIHGIGDPLDTDPIQRWDIGVSTITGLNNGGSQPFAFDGDRNTTNTATTLTNAGAGVSAPGTINIDPTLDGTLPTASGGVGFVNPQDFLIDSLMWRNNTNTSFPVIVAHMVPVNLLADYHLTQTSSTVFAVNAGAASYVSTQPTVTVTAPDHDIDGDQRPLGGYERGADEILVQPQVNLSVTKTTSTPVVNKGDTVRYVITVHNGGPSTATNVLVTDNFPSQLVLTGANRPSSTCTPAADCGFTGALRGNIGRLVTVPPNGDVIFTVATTAGQTAGSFNNTATIVPSASATNNGAGPLSATAQVTIRGTGRLQIFKTVSPTGSVGRGTSLTYTVRVTNTNTGGTNADPITGLTVVDNLPAGFSPSGNWTCAAGTGSACPLASIGGGNLSGLVNIGVGNSAAVVFTITGTATTLGLLSNSASLTVPTTFIPTNNSALGPSNASVTVNPSGNLGIQANVAPTSVSSSASAALRVVTYTVTITNTAGSDSTNATFGGLNNAGLQTPIGTNNSWTCSASGGSSCGTGSTGGQITTPQAGVPSSRSVTVAGGGTVTVTVTARVSSAATVGPLNKTVTITGPTGYDTNTANNSAPANVTVTA